MAAKKRPPMMMPPPAAGPMRKRPAAEQDNDMAVKYGPMALALIVVTVLALILVPLPTFMLDILLALSIGSGLTMMMVTLYTEQQIQLSGFPTILLVMTLFRLGLNISSTRLILTQAYAGKIIEAFGEFVVGGNYVVGIVVFAIITIIQFMVITRGATRVAEVAARFTLDAMPGKQMAIDADLNAGLIDEQEAVKRREEITKKADFYGAMDGASKFVRGDAVAGLIITAINIVGGLIIGMVQLKMPLVQALKTYTLLSIGDGLVSQVPSLITSTTTGLLVSKSSTDKLLGVEISGQILRRPRAFLISSAVLLGLGICPGLPFIPFAIMAGIAFSVYSGNIGKTREDEKALKEEEQLASGTGPDGKPVAGQNSPAPLSGKEAFGQLAQLDPMEIEIGYGLIPMIDREQDGDILDRITQIRKQSAAEMGLIVPPIRIRDNMELPANQYNIKIRGIVVGGGEIRARHLMAMKPGDDYQNLEGIRATEPAFGLPAMWISEAGRAKAEAFGYTVVDPSSVMATHITEVINRHADQLLTRQDTQELMDSLKEHMPAVINDLIPGIVTIGHVHRILQNLLRERIPIRDMGSILETIADYGPMTKDVDILTEYVRKALAGHITRQYQNADGKLSVITLDPKLEQQLIEALQKGDKGMATGLDPAIARQISNRAAQLLDQQIFITSAPVLLCSPAIRRHMRTMLNRHLPHLAVLSFNEITPTATVEAHGTVALEPAAQQA